jgi:phosphatidylserine/phosphatidylglycerophosphate/cardiolipin synthase-like enzyme
MVRFLNTSATNYFLEELIKAARERLIIISPFLKFNDRIRELLEDKDRMKIDVRIVYGKSELAPHEINWLRSLDFVRTSFCQNLHAKCYLSESSAIITSMNLYDFSQVNNNEMGVFIDREEEPDLYRETYEEAQRLIRVSEEVRLSAEKVQDDAAGNAKAEAAPRTADQPPQQKSRGNAYAKLTTSKLAKALGLRTRDLVQKLTVAGLVEKKDGKLELTDAGGKAGGEERISPKYGPYLLWPKDMQV